MAMLTKLALLAVLLAPPRAACHGMQPTHAAAAPTDCRNHTWTQDGGDLIVMSWHVHFLYNTSAMKPFSDAFKAAFEADFPPAGAQCPFGPNYGNNDYPYTCALEDCDPADANFESAEGRSFRETGVGVGGSPWNDAQCAFFIPTKHIAKTWAWSQKHKNGVDLVKHPNTGCMHDDHSLRLLWDLSKGSPSHTINILEVRDWTVPRVYRGGGGVGCVCMKRAYRYLTLFFF